MRVGKEIITMELTYIRVGDYYIPNLIADEPESVRTVGKYGSFGAPT